MNKVNSRMEAAKILGVSLRTVDREREAGRLNWINSRRRILITDDAIDEYLKKYVHR